MDDLLKMLRQLEAEGFFGAVEVKFEGGRVTLIRKSQTYVPNGRKKREVESGQFFSTEQKHDGG